MNLEDLGSASNYVTLIGMNDIPANEDKMDEPMKFEMNSMELDHILQIVNSDINCNKELDNEYPQHSIETTDDCVTLNLGTDDLQCIHPEHMHLKDNVDFNQIQDEIIRNNANHIPIKRRRPLKSKKYESPPSSNAQDELKRKNAILAKRIRDDKKRETENLKATIIELKLIIEKKDSELADAKSRMELLETINKSHAGSLESVHHLVKNFGNSCKK